MTNISSSCSPTDLPAWDEAFQRVESYLRAHGVESRVQLNAFATETIDAARRVSDRDAGIEPVRLAMQVIDERIAAWFGRVFDTDGTRDERVQVRGRLALALADLPGHWPDRFLSDPPAPEELVDTMRDAALQAGPAVRFTNMAPGPIEFSLERGSKNAELMLKCRPLLRAVVLWLIIVGVFGVTWGASH